MLCTGEVYYDLLQERRDRGMEDVAIIPLHIQTNIWAMRRGIGHAARNDELTRPQDVRPAAAAAAAR